ncbi:MAG: hypothetical protein HQ471_05975 [Flavobacteriales bacterium]|nr:hypothetical protein [Flavobacteriales bacterium]
MKKEIGIGFLIGLIATTFGFFAYLEFFVHQDFETMLKFIFEEELFGKMLGLAALPNLFVFFIFLKKKQEYRARGVVLESFLVALLILIAQFL